MNVQRRTGRGTKVVVIRPLALLRFWGRGGVGGLPACLVLGF